MSELEDRVTQLDALKISQLNTWLNSILVRVCQYHLGELAHGCLQSNIKDI